MKNTFFKSALFTAKVSPTHLKFFFMLLMLTMLVLGAGAPSDVGIGH
jgi:hypothetical protein